MANGDDALLPFGQRLQRRREQAGMTRPVLAGLVGRSAEWVKAVESGRLKQPRLPMLLRIAEVLGVADLAELTGDQSVEVASLARGRHPSVAGIKAVVQRYSVLRAARAPFPVWVLRDRVAAAWRLWHTSTDRRTEVGALLPELLGDCQATAQALAGQDRRAAHAVLADAYNLAQHAPACGLAAGGPPRLDRPDPGGRRR
jgi:transcriptional regulator with XRE-family HTH domain